MNNKTRHVIADTVCLLIMAVGFFGFIFRHGIFSFLIGIGFVGMMINEKVNPYDTNVSGEEQ